MRKVFFTLLIIFTFAPVFYARASTPVKILLVPGHDDQVWGAQYGNLKEADMNLVLAEKIFNLLKKDQRFEVHITRDSNGYTKEFADYFNNNQAAITSFMDQAKAEMAKAVASGTFLEKPNTPHNPASEDIALRLYGFNKWANENKMDAVIHIHFNDYARKSIWTLGTRKGFVIYLPDSQFVNGADSAKLAQNIFTELHKKYITSNYWNELGGLISDQKLIALGANNTLIATVKSVLIEYGYIYRFGNSAMRHQAYTNMANLTVAGLDKYFFPK